MLTIRATGDWPPGHVHATWTPSTRRIVPEVERRIDEAWSEATQRLGNKLFDGPMCRLEDFAAVPDRLELSLSRTSYREFLGTNLANAAIADHFGNDVLANPVGLSCALESSDGWLLLGRRNDWVAYYPGRVHPFAGALEPGDPLDVFADLRRELEEELSMRGGDIADLRCIGLVEDDQLRQPELIFHVKSSRTRQQAESRLDRDEHHATYSIPAARVDVEQALRDGLLTPVACASLLLWGKARFGNLWFARESGKRVSNQ